MSTRGAYDGSPGVESVVVPGKFVSAAHRYLDGAGGDEGFDIVATYAGHTKHRHHCGE